MKHIKIEAFSIPDARFKTINAIWYYGEHFNVGHGSEETDTKKLDITIHIAHPENKPYADDSSTTDDKHIGSYALEYILTDFLGDHPYTYGWRLRHPVDQIEKLINDIIKNPSNRQLTMTVRIPEDVNNKEPPCLTMIDVEVMDGKANMTCYFRSWDAYGALNENIGGLYLLLKYIVDEINERSGSNYQTGEMIFHSKNCHIYQRCYEFVKQLLKIDDKSLEEKKRHPIQPWYTMNAPNDTCSESDCSQRDICRGQISKCVLPKQYKPKPFDKDDYPAPPELKIN